MSRFQTLLKLDLLLILKNRILATAAMITALYCGLLQALPEKNFSIVLTTLIFTDPVMLGFMFTGVMVLFEKSSNTLQAVSVTPVRAGEYLWSKAASLTMVALAASLIMALAGVGINFHLFYLTTAVVLTSLLFVFIGIVGVSYVKTFNQYFIIIPLFMIPGFLPFLGYFGIYDSWLWYLIPTQASLILFRSAFEEKHDIGLIHISYAVVYLIISIWFAYEWARKSWNKIIR
jgi:fluoroquinolone transport system permease protein